jgi:O-antigen/teichoic acid export membrane protein
VDQHLPLAFSSGMGIVTRQASILILGLFVSAADVGVYRVAAQTSLLAAFGLDAVNMVVAPRFATLFARGEAERLQRLVTASARVILAFSLVVTVGFVVFGKPFLRLVFGAPYEAAYLPMVILLAGQLVNSATGSVGALLNMTRNERETAKGMAVAAASNVALNLALIPILGTAGAAMATAASLVTWNVLMWRSVRRRLGVNSLAFHVGKARVAPTVNSDSA